ncbi:acyltransferase family protein [Rickettsiales endosymbiont of Stachyamoeba lipophora]|uniref:acyltransferase family protein n=1 Tax=Rickettsiales endosymbiont of Stachyamoeba lipophora TaxID=2486578 RepID=UPI000F64A494|nr:acyltransferase [Rickettsiales endosymbiont of Stachyamoeba lipophora]AZL16375.1 acyltransferase [Rickettsiales endosymbiont of Stachyamoeba lipophora]
MITKINQLSHQTLPHKIYSIQLMRAIAALMVMFAHFLSDAEKYNKITTNIGTIKPYLLNGVDIFFFISGFVITLLYVTKNDSCSQFIKKRAIRILPTYYIFTFLAFCMWLIKPTLFNNAVDNRTDILASFLLIPSKPDHLHLLSVAWTLCFEVWFYAFFALSIALFKRAVIIPITLYTVYLSFLLLSKNYGVATTPDNSFLNLLNSAYCLEFLTGSLFCYIYSFKKFKVIPILFLALGGLWIADTSMLLVTLMGIFLFLSLEIYSKYLPVPKFFILLGDSSYSLYLSHLLIMGAVKHIWDRFLGFASGDLVNIIWMLSMILASIMFNLIYYKLIDQKTNQYLCKKFL